MSIFKICGCHYVDTKDKSHNGIYIHNRKTNTFIIVNKNRPCSLFSFPKL